MMSEARTYRNMLITSTRKNWILDEWEFSNVKLDEGSTVAHGALISELAHLMLYSTAKEKDFNSLFETNWSMAENSAASASYQAGEISTVFQYKPFDLGENRELGAWLDARPHVARNQETASVLMNPLAEILNWEINERVSVASTGINLANHVTKLAFPPNQEAAIQALPVSGSLFSFGDNNADVRSANAVLPPNIAQSNGIAHAAGQLLVQFSGNASDIGKARALAAIGGKIEEVIVEHGGPFGTSGQLVLVSFDQSLPTSRAITMLLRDAAVESAEQNWFYQTQAFTSNDQYYANGNLWGMYGEQTSPKNIFGSGASEAWGSGFIGSTSVVIGVIDTGIDPTHPDLYLNIWLNQLEIPAALRAVLVDVDGDGIITFRDLNHVSNASFVTDHNKNGRIDALDLLADSRWADGKDTSGNGRIDDLVGWNFWGNNNLPFLASDGDAHGTHVAGTIGALGGNNIGVAGVNWNVQLMPLKFLGPDGGFTSGGISAIDYYTWYAKNDSSLSYVATNNSWGGGGFSTALRDAIVRGALEDILFVAAAGNSGQNLDTNPSYPAAYSTISFAGYEAVLSVAAISSTGALASFSNFGSVNVDLGAPGVSIWSTTPNGGYASYNGTSMASPHVAGAIALFAAANPTATATEIWQAIMDSTQLTTSLTGKTASDGRLDIAALMEGVAIADVYVMGIVVQDNLITMNETLQVTINFSKAVTFLETNPFDSVSLTLDSLLTTNGGSTWIATFTPDLNLENNQAVIKVKAGSYIAIDGGSTGPEAVSGTFAIDTRAPSVASVALTINDLNNDGVLSTGESATLKISFSEAIQSLTLEAISIKNAVDGALVSGLLENLESVDDGLNWTVRFTPANGQKLDFVVEIAAGYRDLAGNVGSLAEISNTHFRLDTTGPLPTGQLIYGSSGNSVVEGTAFDDIIYGIASDDTLLGRGTVDWLYGGAGADIFMLGDQRGAFYDDGNPRNAGRSDYAVIRDFNSEQGDKIHLAAGVRHLFANISIDGFNGVGIYVDTDNNGRLGSRDELIGIIENVSVSSLVSTDFIDTIPDDHPALGGGIEPTPKEPELAFTFVYGEDGNSNVDLSSVSDINHVIFGIAQDSTQLGRGTIDTLIGSNGIDIFMLGDQRGLFYDDGNARNAGLADYALVQKFTAGKDFLHMAANDRGYELVQADSNVQIFAISNGRNHQNELIAVVENVDRGAVQAAMIFELPADAVPLSSGLDLYSYVL
jgi:subtilisin family serine protease